MELLKQAIRHNDLEGVKILIEHGVDVNTTDEHNETALHLASRYGCIKVAKYLVENGASVNSMDSEFTTALFLACANGHTDIAQYLLDHGAFADLEPNPVFDALSYNRHDCVKLLLPYCTEYYLDFVLCCREQLARYSVRTDRKKT